MSNAVRELLECVGSLCDCFVFVCFFSTIRSSLIAMSLGEDPKRSGLEDTPLRMSKALLFFTKGYEQDLEEVVHGAVFDEPNADGMVIMKDIQIFSLCEHHMVSRKTKTGHVTAPQPQSSKYLHFSRSLFLARLTLPTCHKARFLDSLSLHAYVKCLLVDCRFKNVSLTKLQKPSKLQLEHLVLVLFWSAHTCAYPCGAQKSTVLSPPPVPCWANFETIQRHVQSSWG